MARERNIKEWIGRNDDAMPPRSVFDRLWEKQGGKDAITDLPFQPGDKVVRDHIIPLADGGENRESNLQLITEQTHRKKTAQEALERAEYRTRRASHRGYARGPQPGSLPGNRIRYSRARGVHYDRFTGEIIKDTQQ